jgi:heme-degrading monooxygenase HmoA
MFARVSRLQENIDDLDEGVRVFREKLLPQVEAIPGFVGLQQLVNRTTGETLAVTFWDSEEAMGASESQADQIREEAAGLTAGEIRSVERYEVVLRVGL